LQPICRNYLTLAIMITPELKDKLLSIIVENAPNFFAAFSIHDMGKELTVSHQVIDALLKDYERRGFMTVQRMLGGLVHCHLEITAQEFLRKGGYYGEEIR